jgi:hypothetical protein
MRDTMSLGSTPWDEDCEQVPYKDGGIKARRECRAYINQLKRQWPDWETVGVAFRISSNPHDFGTYHDVEVVWDDQGEEQIRLAYAIEGELPEKWDQEAQAELAGVTP